MSRKLKPHVQQDLVKRFEQFRFKTVDGMRPFDDYISRMSPSDGVACLGFLKRASRDIRDAANDLVATVDAHAERVQYMKDTNRKDRERN